MKKFVGRHHGDVLPRMLDNVERWLTLRKKYLGVELEGTATRDFGMIELWDDRAVGVYYSTGEVRTQEQARKVSRDWA